MTKKEAFEKFGEKCPECNSEWAVTSFNTKVWLDCISCSKKAEDIIEAKNKRDKAKEPDYDNNVIINDYPYYYPF